LHGVEGSRGICVGQMEVKQVLPLRLRSGSG
jgi:hypothetical protein